MQDRELYRRILGIETPWYVESVDLKLESGEVHVHLRHHDMIHWPCPETGSLPLFPAPLAYKVETNRILNAEAKLLYQLHERRPKRGGDPSLYPGD